MAMLESSLYLLVTVAQSGRGVAVIWPTLAETLQETAKRLQSSEKFVDFRRCST
jgi:hypothetical protein